VSNFRQRGEKSNKMEKTLESSCLGIARTSWFYKLILSFCNLVSVHIHENIILSLCFVHRHSKLIRKCSQVIVMIDINFI